MDMSNALVLPEPASDAGLAGLTADSIGLNAVFSNSFDLNRTAISSSHGFDGFEVISLPDHVANAELEPMSLMGDRPRLSNLQFDRNTFISTDQSTDDIHDALNGPADHRELQADSLINPVKLPKLKGDFKVGTRFLTLRDGDRLETFTPEPNDVRRVAVQVWYPTDSVKGATRAEYLDSRVVDALAASYAEFLPPDFVTQALSSVKTRAFLDVEMSTAQDEFPVLIFSPGSNEMPQFYTSQLQQLASQGYIVVGISHTYESSFTLLSNRSGTSKQLVQRDPSLNEEPDTLEEAYRFGRQMTRLRTADVRFVLDELERLDQDEEGFDGKLDLSSIGVFGHSLGGATAAEVVRRDRRVDAGINLDGTLWSRTQTTGVSRPFMTVASGLEAPDTTQRTFFEASGDSSYFLTIQGTEHYSFSDHPILSATGIPFPNIGSLSPRKTAAITNDYTLAFFNQHLLNQESDLLNGAVAPHPEVGLERR